MESDRGQRHMLWERSAWDIVLNSLSTEAHTLYQGLDQK
jgi:hypothetical protein